MDFEQSPKILQRKKMVLFGLVCASLLVIAAFGFTTRDSATNFRNPRYLGERSGKRILLAGSLTWLNLLDRVMPDPTPAVDYENPSSNVSSENSHIIYLPEIEANDIPIAAECLVKDIPVGAIPGQPGPIFCSITNHGPDTSNSGINSWVDEFNHGLSFADFSGTHYKIFEAVGFIDRTLHWRHAEHWMVDLATNLPQYPVGWVRGGAFMRPDRTFRFENGKLVIEADVAAGIEAYDGHAWPELVISTSSQPIDLGGSYGYDMFPEGWTLGCRLQSTRDPICALKSNDGDIAARKGSSRIWEMSATQLVGKSVYGGFPAHGLENYWRSCEGTNPDMNCRDRFRLELTQTSLTLYVNGQKYFEQINIPTLPKGLTSGNLYIYFASMVGSHPAETIRFHWDRLAINPNSPPSPAPGFIPPQQMPLLKNR